MLPIANKFVIFGVLLNALVVQILKTQAITKIPFSCMQYSSDSQSDYIKSLLHIGEIIGLNETY